MATRRRTSKGDLIVTAGDGEVAVGGRIRRSTIVIDKDRVGHRRTVRAGKGGVVVTGDLTDATIVTSGSPSKPTKKDLAKGKEYITAIRQLIEENKARITIAIYNEIITNLDTVTDELDKPEPNGAIVKAKLASIASLVDGLGI